MLQKCTTSTYSACSVSYKTVPLKYKTDMYKNQHSIPSSNISPLLTCLTCSNFSLVFVFKCNIQLEMFLIFIILGFYVLPCTYKAKRKRARGSKD